MFWSAYVGHTSINAQPQGPILGSTGPTLAREGPLESKVGEKRLIFTFGGDPLDQGGPSTANFTPVTRALAALLVTGICVHNLK